MRAVATPGVAAGPLTFQLFLDRMRDAAGGPAAGPRLALGDPPPLPLATPGPKPEQAAAGPVPAPNVPDLAVTFRAESRSRPVELAISPDLNLKLIRAGDGVAVLLETAPVRTLPVEAELPRIVGALRARGIAVVSAAVQATPGRSRRGGGAR